ncbi:chalcone isomerase family protein [Hydrogenophaga sp.]|uniref:chalcone isomerase family protein n=1 Tax=Hydrogenophaga sp. TaxID=1904254 RepID=UPI0019864B22|nr:chalcone isomerase family protein [Hydrogenophaga sp.]MBD3893030.1 hypothetical protein [Hydrogenophaga sp.]
MNVITLWRARAWTLPLILFLLLTLSLSLKPLGAAAQTVSVSGVTLENRIMLGGSALQLNGAGVRTRAVFRVYVAGLYLSRPATNLEEVLAAPGPKRLSVTMLRDIDTAVLGRLFARGIENNIDRRTFSRLIPGVIRMSQIFTDHRQLRAGDTFTIDWLPGSGTVISVKGQVAGEPFTEPEFFDAMMRIWLGAQPAEQALKDALLGRSP